MKKLHSTPSSKFPSPIRLFSMNCYLIPGWLVNSHSYTCKDQDKRATAIGNEAAKHDIITLQEVWGSNVDKIANAVAATHHVPSIHLSVSLFGYFATVFDTVRNYINATGGLWSASRRVSIGLALSCFPEPSIMRNVDCGRPSAL